jgi:hypothetical protein
MLVEGASKESPDAGKLETPLFTAGFAEGSAGDWLLLSQKETISETDRRSGFTGRLIWEGSAFVIIIISNARCYG